MTRKALGRGLDALIPTEGAKPADEAAREDLRELPVDMIQANPWQPRSEASEEGLGELVASIRENGVLQPVVVRRTEAGYQLVAGERRFVACKLAGLSEVPVVVREVTDRQMVELALVENLQREDLNPIDEARAYKRLQDEFSLTQEEIAEKVGKDRASVANQIRLLQLPHEIQDYVSRGTLSAGHGRALLAIEDPAKQLELGQAVASRGLSVRETERLTKRKTKARRKKGRGALPAEIAALEENVREHLATRVAIRPSGRGGTIEIQYYSSEDLERILERIGALRAPFVM
jgi:ParB family chromosome partitioning protein